MKTGAQAAWALLVLGWCLAAGGPAWAQTAGQARPLAGSPYTTAARSRLVDELCQCAVASKVAGAMALGSNDVETHRKAAARTREFLTAAKAYMSPQYVEARYKSMALPWLAPQRLVDASANAFILERAHMCAYIVQNTQERLRYWQDLAAGR